MKASDEIEAMALRLDLIASKVLSNGERHLDASEEAARLRLLARQIRAIEERDRDANDGGRPIGRNSYPIE